METSAPIPQVPGVNPQAAIEAGNRQREINQATTIERDNALRDKTIVDMNAQHALITIDGAVYILSEVRDRNGRPSFELSRTEDLRKLYENRPKVPVPGADGKIKHVHPFDYWMTHKARREYRGLGFFATRPAPAGYYNIWKGLAVQPVPGDWSLLRKHIWEVICSCNLDLFQWVLAWLADGVRRPGETGHTILVMKGKEGIGKNKLVDWYGKIFGRHYLALTSTGQLTGRFNQHLAEAVLVFANEAVWAGDKSALGALKAMATDSERFIEPKRVNGYMIDNAVRIVMASNEDWVVPAGENARRFAVLEVSDAHREDFAYFAAIDAQMQAGGLQAMLHELLTMDISTVQLRKAPYTRALLEQKERTLDGVDRFVLDFIRSAGSGLVVGRPTNWETTEAVIPSDAVHKLYLETMTASEGRSRKSLETEFGMQLRKLVPGVVRVQRSRVWCLKFPPLPECRQQIADYMRSPVVDLFFPLTMTDKAGNVSLEQFTAAGWTPELLIEHGYAR
jgi:hypothetical protein